MSNPNSAKPVIDAQSAVAQNPAAAPSRKKPIELRQSKVVIEGSVMALRISMHLASSTHVYAIAIYPGFTGGGRDAENALAPRVHAPEFSPKFVGEDGQTKAPWPPLPAVERWVDGRVWTDTQLPEGTIPQRLEKAMAKVEPLLRQLVNQRQVHMGQGKAGQVADQPLIARIKAILAEH